MKPLVLVEWEDSVTPEQGAWVEGKRARKMRPARCWSVGWMLKRNKRFVTLVPTVARAAKTSLSPLTIPAGCVRGIYPLTEGKRIK